MGFSRTKWRFDRQVQGLRFEFSRTKSRFDWQVQALRFEFSETNSRFDWSVQEAQFSRIDLQSVKLTDSWQAGWEAALKGVQRGSASVKTKTLLVVAFERRGNQNRKYSDSELRIAKAEWVSLEMWSVELPKVAELLLKLEVQMLPELVKAGI